MKKIRGFFLIIYMALTFLMFLTFKTSVIVWLSFFLSALILFGITIYHLYYEKDYSPFLSSYIVFTYLFFLAAPITQISSFFELESPKFVNYFPYKQNLVVYANLLISVFNGVFILSYIFFKKHKLKSSIEKQKKPSNSFLLPFVILVLAVISFLVFLASYGFIQDELLRPNWMPSKVSISTLLLWKKCLFFIPFAGVIMCFQYFNKKNKTKNNYINIIIFFIFMLIILFWFKNPLTEKRNALGPIYISLIFLFIPKFLNSNIKTITFLFFSMIILFPLTAILTHTDASLIEIYKNPMILINSMKGGGITNALNTLNYDAFANITTTIDYVYNNGFSYGYQLLGGVLFFIPRSFWVSKPISSGELIGDYLVNSYGFNFTNLSNSFVSESFINFGLIGIIIYPIILSYIFIKMMAWLNGENYLKKIMAFYFAIHLIFLLRGDFTNGYSYYIAPLIVVIFLPRMIEIILKNFSKK